MEYGIFKNLGYYSHINKKIKICKTKLKSSIRYLIILVKIN